jgi:hypothetical protein
LITTKELFHQRSVQVVIAVWIASVAFVALSVRTLPFNWGGMAMPGIASMTDMSTGFQLMSANIQILFVLFQQGARTTQDYWQYEQGYLTEATLALDAWISRVLKLSRKVSAKSRKAG